MGEKNKIKKKHFISIVYNILFYLFITILIVIAIINILGEKKGKHPNIFGYSTYYIMTGSMKPKIDVGSLVIVKNGTNEDIKEGDIITFNGASYDTITTHRVYKIINGGEEFITKGDANNTEDPMSVKKNQIIGKVMFHIPYVGEVSQFIQKNLLIIIILFLGIFGFSFVIKRIQN